LVTSGTSGALRNFVAGSIGYLNVALNPQGKYSCTHSATSSTLIPAAGCTITLPVSSPNFSRSNRYQDGAAYANDSWKATPKLTINLGLRWEIYGPQHSQQPGYDSNFFLGTGSNIWDQVRTPVDDPRYCSNGRLWNLNKTQFAPKVGFAWDPFGNGKTSVRGGYSMSYERNFNNVTFNVIQNPPNYAVVAFTSADNGGVPIPISNNNFSTFGTGTGTKLLPP